MLRSKFILLTLMQSIQDKQEVNTLWKWNEMFQSELISVNNFDDPKEPFQGIKQVDVPTTVSPIDRPKLKLKTNSKKKLTPKHQISFQKNFMKEHIAAFQKYYQNHVESLKLKPSGKNIQQIVEEFFVSNRQISNHCVWDILKMQKTDLSGLQIQQFLRDLEYQQKFHEFLNFVCSFCQPNMAIGFISVAYYVWMFYVPMQNEQFIVSEIVQLSQKIAKHQIKKSLSNFFKAYFIKMEKVNEEFEELIEIYCATILLTINGYFQNPFYYQDSQINGNKRSFNYDIFSDNESSQSFSLNSPDKKRKLSAS